MTPPEKAPGSPVAAPGPWGCWSATKGSDVIKLVRDTGIGYEEEERHIPINMAASSVELLVSLQGVLGLLATYEATYNIQPSKEAAFAENVIEAATQGGK